MEAVDVRKERKILNSMCHTSTIPFQTAMTTPAIEFVFFFSVGEDSLALSLLVPVRECVFPL